MNRWKIFTCILLIALVFSSSVSYAYEIGEHDFWTPYIASNIGSEMSYSISEEETRQTYMDMLYEEYKDSFSEDAFWDLLLEKILYIGSEYISINFSDHSISCNGFNTENKYTCAYWNFVSTDTLYEFAYKFIADSSVNKNQQFWKDVVFYITFRQDVTLYYYQGSWFEGDTLISNPQLVIEGWKTSASSFDYKQFFSDFMWKMTKEEADALLVRSGLERHSMYNYNLTNPHTGSNGFDVVQIGYTGYYAFGAYSNMINVYYDLDGKPVQAYINYYASEDFDTVLSELQDTFGPYDNEGYYDWQGSYENEDFYLWNKESFKVVLLSQNGSMELAKNGEGSFCIYLFLELPESYVVK